MAWTDPEGQRRLVPEPVSAAGAYRPIAAHQGAAYARNAFTHGTEQEASFLWSALGLTAGARVLDVGCGTGRHVRALGARGAAVVGVDSALPLLAAAGVGGLVCADAGALPLPEACVDAVLSLCQGGFGVTPSEDRCILDELVRVLRPGGRLALTAFSLPFAARWLAPEDRIDLVRGLVWHPAEVRNGDGQPATFDLWTTCYSPAHLLELVTARGLDLEVLSGVEPGRYTAETPRLTDPELLVIARRPALLPAGHRDVDQR